MPGSSKNLAFEKTKSPPKKKRQNSLVSCQPQEAEHSAALTGCSLALPTPPHFVPKVSENLVQRDGDFLVRDSLSSPGNFVLTCQWKNLAQHFKIRRTVLRLSEAYSRVQYQFETESFDSIPGLVRCYVGNRRPISQQSGAVIFQPINRTMPLRCLEERYGVSPGRARDSSLPEVQQDAGKRLSLTMGGVQAREQSSPQGNLLRWVRASLGVCVWGGGAGTNGGPWDRPRLW